MANSGRFSSRSPAATETCYAVYSLIPNVRDASTDFFESGNIFPCLGIFKVRSPVAHTTSFFSLSRLIRWTVNTEPPTLRLRRRG